MTDYLAIAVVCLHLAIALVHTIWILVFQETSDSWDSSDELLALVWNSEPSKGAPSNTCAGINDRHTLSSRVQVRVVDPTPGVGTETVQLVAVQKVNGLAEVKVNTAYGAKL